MIKFQNWPFILRKKNTQIRNKLYYGNCIYKNLILDFTVHQNVHKIGDLALI